jgi:hypothetical protein
MNELQTNPLIIEWTTLQNQYDAYEKLSLVIKLCAIFVTIALIFDIKHPALVLFFNVIFWIQDAVWKTFQSRFAERLINIEHSLLLNQLSTIAFNTEWEKKPRSIIKLLSEYLRHIVKPTIIFPHAILFLVSFYAVIIA